MTVIGQVQKKKIETALALCAQSAGSIERFDEAVSRLDAAEREIALRGAGRRLRQAGEELARLRALAAAVEELERAAAHRAIVIEALDAEGALGPRVCLALIGQPAHLVAGILPGVELRELHPGDEVEVVRTGPDQYAVRGRVGRHLRHGPVACVEEIPTPGLLRVSNGSEQLFLRASGALCRELEELGENLGEVVGRSVSFDAQLGLAFALWGASQKEQLALREFPRVKRDELVLDPRLLRFLEEEILLPRREVDLARSYGVSPGQSYVFHGPPGVGKTHMARWIATELDQPVYLISGSELANQWYGGTEARLRARLEAAEREPNGAVLVWDEAEAMLGERGRSVVGVEDRIVSLMLSFLDGFTRHANVLTILTTNRIDQLDVALKRQLRATPIPFARPDAPRTRALFQLYLRDLACADAEPESLARDATLAVHAEREPIAQAVLRDSSRFAIPRSAAVSGTLVRAACERAQRIAFVRHALAGARGARRGMLREDLLFAIDEQFASVAEAITRESLGQTVTLPPECLTQVVAVERSAVSNRRRYVCDPVAA